MKKIIFLIIALLAVVVFFVWRKVRTLMNMTIDVSDFKFIKNGLLSYQVKLNIILKNFQDTQIQIQQLKTDIYTNKDVLLLEQDKPLQYNYNLLPHATLKIPVIFNLDTAGALNFFTNSGLINSWSDIGTLLSNYASTGEFGIPLRIKGFAQAESLHYNFDKTINV